MMSFSRIFSGILFCLYLAPGPGFLASEALPADEIIVSAAASLTNAFTELGAAYEHDNAGSSIVLNFGGSGQLLQQIDRGAPVDVFASADQETMNRADERNLILPGSRIDFAGNTMVLIAPADSALKLADLGQLRTSEIRRIAISNPVSVPVGRYARLALQSAGLWDELAPRLINTQHVRQSLDYVARGEVDVGFVYATDSDAMHRRVKVLMAIAPTIPITYPIAVTSDSRKSELARQFIEFVISPRGQAILSGYGFTSSLSNP